MRNEIIYAIVISYRSYDALVTSLSSLEKMVIPKNIELNVVVVDGGSNKKSVYQLKKKFPKVKFIMKSINLGVGKSFNLGMDYARKRKADYYFLLNADIAFEPDYLYKVYNKIKLNKKYGAASGKIVYSTRPLKILFIGGILDPKVKSTIHIGTGEVDKGQYNGNEKTELLNCPLLIRKDVIEVVGGFRETYFMYYEDADFYYRVRKAGYNLILETSACAYSEFEDEDVLSAKLMKKNYYLSRNLPYFIKYNFNVFEKIIAYSYIAKNSIVLILDCLKVHRKNVSYYKLLGIKDFLIGKKGYKKIE